MAAELLSEFEPEIEHITLVPSDGGRFEITVNDQLIYSKQQLHRHADPGEVTKLVQKLVRP